MLQLDAPEDVILSEIDQSQKGQILYNSIYIRCLDCQIHGDKK